MTQISPQYVIIPDERQSNMLGIVGFVLSLLGILGTAGLLCPVGLVLSLIALGRPPRGFAVAGVILGLLGTCGGIIVAIIVIGFLLAALAGAASLFVLTQTDRIEISSDMGNMVVAIQQYQQEHRGVAPAGLSGLGLQPSGLLDPWGHEYRYMLTDKELGFDIISNGRDGVADTDDDISLCKLDDFWSGALVDFEQRMEEMDARHRRLRMGVEIESDEDSGGVETSPAPSPSSEQVLPPASSPPASAPSAQPETKESKPGSHGVD